MEARLIAKWLRQERSGGISLPNGALSVVYAEPPALTC
jgi:hypothetical protein